MDYPKRKYPRLKDYDYSLPGYYYVTIHTANDRISLSRIVPGTEHQQPQIQLSAAGHAVEQQLLELQKRYPNVHIDKYVIMPTHIHAIVQLLPAGEKALSLLQIVGAYKSLTTRLCNQIFASPGGKLFQTSFYETVLRNEQAYQECWQYIDENPAKWIARNETSR